MIIVPAFVKIYKALRCCPSINIVELTKLIYCIVFKRPALKFCHMTAYVFTSLKTRSGQAEFVMSNNTCLVIYSEVTATCGIMF